jgi:tetratricopeptide (TPR) repeat protein
MSQYSVRQVRDIVGLSVPMLRRLVDAGFVTPARGKRREYRFGFQDLVVLRMAKALTDAQIPPRRISASLKRLRKQLPAEAPMTGLRIAALGNTVVVSDGAARWRADDGQYLLAFEIAGARGEITFVEPQPQPTSDIAWLEHALQIEAMDAAGAIAAYEKAVREDACRPGAYTNWGRLLHEAGRYDDAEAVYAKGISACPDDALLLFNFAVLREDQGRNDDAIAFYKRALAKDPRLYDAHYNLGLLYRSLDRAREAVRHLNAYRKLRAGAE